MATRFAGDTMPKLKYDNTGQVIYSCPPRSFTEVVQEIPGEPLRFHVLSRSSNRRHLVDLQEYDNNGRCDCEHFIFKLEPFLARGMRSRKLRCWHIAEAREFALQAFLARVALCTKRMETKNKAGAV